MSFVKKTALLLLVLNLAACSRPAQITQPIFVPTEAPTQSPQATATPLYVFSTRVSGDVILSPTPDLPHNVPTLRSETVSYTIQSGDTLGGIALLYDISVDDLMTANDIVDENVISVGQILTIPVSTDLEPGSDFKILPDSELVNGPAAAAFDVAAFVQEKAGYLAHYTGSMEAETLDGATILANVARDYSVNPRLLLAILEYQSGWVTDATPDSATLDYPMQYTDPNRTGLYKQLAFAADHLNRGFYLWQEESLSSLILADNSAVRIPATLNAGTVGVQYLMSLFFGLSAWEQAVGEEGILATYQSFFGYPFNYAVDPLLPTGLVQPVFQLPFETGAVWAYTSGPHSAWGSYTAWAALDFAPPGEPMGCVLSDAWIVAMAPGLIVRSENGAVVEDLDGDGYEQTGWTILYMHIDSSQRVAVGTQVEAGDRIGHPSCEGGVSNGTHTHLARRYNGEWIPAYGTIPFNLEGWIASSTGDEYDGYLTRDQQSIEAWADRSTAENQIQR
jgi:LasA protease